MTKSELTIEEKLRALYDLQLVDSRVDEIRLTRGELPLEVADLEDEIVGLETRIENLKLKNKELETQAKTFKEDIENAKVQITKYEKQQSNVRNNREFDALSKEVEYQGLEIELFEKKIKECKFKIDSNKQSIKDNEEILEHQKIHLGHKVSELDILIAETQKEENFLLEKSTIYANLIEDHLFKMYHRIRTSVKNGLAVVPIERGASSGSYYTIPPQLQIEVAQRKRVVFDEHSGRILVDIELAEEEKTKLVHMLTTFK